MAAGMGAVFSDVGRGIQGAMWVVRVLMVILSIAIPGARLPETVGIYGTSVALPRL
jgi:hypothetical protein